MSQGWFSSPDLLAEASWGQFLLALERSTSLRSLVRPHRRMRRSKYSGLMCDLDFLKSGRDLPPTRRLDRRRYRPSRCQSLRPRLEVLWVRCGGLWRLWERVMLIGWKNSLDVVADRS